jgi:hypothetical protein
VLATSDPPREIRGIEIQADHARSARASALKLAREDVQVEIDERDLFTLDVGADIVWQNRGPLLVIGNPPWVTTAALGAMASPERPPRANVKGLRGLEARTGSANFDVSEAVWLKLANELRDQNPTIALLCKTSVARNILQFAHRASLPIRSASIRRIDAARWFGAAVDACWFCARLESGQTLEVPVYANLSDERPEAIMGFAGEWLVADIAAYAQWRAVEGQCPRDWRQGLKHDAAPVMELSRDHAGSDWHNRNGEPVSVEPEYVYPLVKATDIQKESGNPQERAVLVPQSRLGESTERLRDLAPRLWTYLESHGERFAKRKSSIYRDRPPFSIFGIGPYSFAPYKVVISGMHKVPRFRLLGPIRGKPVMVDDTCYFLPCATAAEGAVLAAICNDPRTLGLIQATSFPHAKRPITKKLLQRIDLLSVLTTAKRHELVTKASAILANDLSERPDLTINNVIEGLAAEFAGAREGATTTTTPQTTKRKRSPQAESI